MEIKTVTVIGQGNVASHYCKIMNEKGIKTKTVCSRTPFNAEDLAADLIVIAVKDDAIEQICRQTEPFAQLINSNRSIFVHTSGFNDTQCLKNIFSCYGSFYPLQTLKKGITIDFNTVPLCTWANTDEGCQALEQLALKLSPIHYVLTDSQRKALHLSAVFVNNFPNHLFAIANRILEKNNIPFSTLFPLMERTVAAAKENNPLCVQTGPAFRNEISIMEEHKACLNNEERKIYEILSESIIKEHSNR